MLAGAADSASSAASTQTTCPARVLLNLACLPEKRRFKTFGLAAWRARQQSRFVGTAVFDIRISASSDQLKESEQALDPRVISRLMRRDGLADSDRIICGLSAPLWSKHTSAAG